MKPVKDYPPLGQTLSVVGGLIIGDAAIRSGFISPSVIVITALSAIAGYTLVNQILAGAVSILRGFVLLCSILMGLYGFMLAGFVIVLYISRLRSFGIPYLALVFPKSSSDFSRDCFVYRGEVIDIELIISEPMIVLKRTKEKENSEVAQNKTNNYDAYH